MYTFVVITMCWGPIKGNGKTLGRKASCYNKAFFQ